MKKFSLVIFTFLLLITGVGKAQYNVLINFNDTNGGWPFGSLVTLGGRLYGTNFTGGRYSNGNIFSINSDGSGYKDLFDFHDSIGGGCNSPLILSGKSFFGTTQNGGKNGDGVVFSIDTNGSGYKVLLSFNDTNGKKPFGSLTLAVSGNVLYGVTALGGVHDSGVVFSIDTNGNGYKDLLNFNGTNGFYADGSLVLLGKSLYGMTENGGANGEGLIFSLDTNGSNYKDLLDFNGTNGAGPEGGLTLSGGLLYGAAYGGGANGYGLLFSIDTNGSGYKDIHNFNDTDGAYPEENGGSLILSGNKLFGETEYGGAYRNGVVFSLDTNGMGYKILFDFDSTDGAESEGSLTLSGNYIYGATVVGGLYGYGVLFSLDTLGCLNNYDQDICIVTTDTNINKNVIIWGRNNSPPDGFFNIYDSISSGWVKIGSVADTALSEYIDTTSNPDSKSYSYRISTVDSCGESSLSPFNSTIYLQVVQLATKDSLFWTPYIGFVTPNYLIYRGLSLNTLTLIDSVSGSVLYYNDSLPPAGSIYLVEAINPSGGCTPTHKHITPMHQTYSSTSVSLSNGGIPHKVTGIAVISSPANAVHITPNPNNGEFTIKSSVDSRQSTVEVYNVLGEKVFTQPLRPMTQGQSRQAQGDNQINLTNEPSGVYLYRMLTESGELISEGKFVIQK